MPKDHHSAAANAPPGDGEQPTLDLLVQLSNTLWLPDGMDEAEKVTRIRAAHSKLEDIEPSGGIETMLACQMVAAHEAAMECLRRAVANDQSDDGRDRNLKHGERLLAIYARQVEVLGRHRCREQQLEERRAQQDAEQRQAERREEEQQFWERWLAEQGDAQQPDAQQPDAAASLAEQEVHGDDDAALAAESDAAAAAAIPENAPGTGDGANGDGANGDGANGDRGNGARANGARATGRRSYLNPGGI